MRGKAIATEKLNERTTLPPAWRQTSAGLHITLPAHEPEVAFAAALRIHVAA